MRFIAPNGDKPSSLRNRRFAANQTVFRRLNERLSRQFSGAQPGFGQYVCECGDDSCSDPVALRPDEYEHVRSNPTWFLISPGHEILAGDAERIVESHDHHDIVEKSGAAGSVAEATATRRR